MTIQKRTCRACATFNPEKPPGLRRFHGEPVTRLIVSVPMATVKSVDSAMRPSRNRSEFVRLAIEEKLARIPAKK